MQSWLFIARCICKQWYIYLEVDPRGYKAIENKRKADMIFQFSCLKQGLNPGPYSYKVNSYKVNCKKVIPSIDKWTIRLLSAKVKLIKNCIFITIFTNHALSSGATRLSVQINCVLITYPPHLKYPSRGGRRDLEVMRATQWPGVVRANPGWNPACSSIFWLARST